MKRTAALMMLFIMFVISGCTPKEEVFPKAAAVGRVYLSDSQSVGAESTIVFQIAGHTTTIKTADNGEYVANVPLGEGTATVVTLWDSYDFDVSFTTANQETRADFRVPLPDGVTETFFRQLAGSSVTRWNRKDFTFPESILSSGDSGFKGAAMLTAESFNFTFDGLFTLDFGDTPTWNLLSLPMPGGGNSFKPLVELTGATPITGATINMYTESAGYPEAWPHAVGHALGLKDLSATGYAMSGSNFSNGAENFTDQEVKAIKVLYSLSPGTLLANL